MQSGPSGQPGGTSGAGVSPSATTGAQQTGRPASSATATAAVPDPAAATAHGGSADGTLRPGDRGPAVARLQQLLFDQGFTYVAVTGVYDDATTRGVTQLQQNRGLTADPPGVYGPQSRASLDPGN
jgi:peptidoglycan hydrolase-like protein with peptidoglycan-binding domain